MEMEEAKEFRTFSEKIRYKFREKLLNDEPFMLALETLDGEDIRNTIKTIAEPLPGLSSLLLFLYIILF